MEKIPEGMICLEVSLRSKMLEVTSDLGLLLSSAGVHLSNAFNRIAEQDANIRELKAKLAEAEDHGRAEGMRCLREVLVGGQFIERDDELETLDAVRVLLNQWQRQRRKIEDGHSVLESVKASRNKLRAKLAEAEKRNDTLLSHNKALANGLQNDGLWGQAHDELIRVTRERDELARKLAKAERESAEMKKHACWRERERHCSASFAIYEACAQQRIAELEAKLAAAEVGAARLRVCIGRLDRLEAEAKKEVKNDGP
jgi:hypothetical protein